MAFKTWVAGEVFTASDVNTYLGKQAVIVCTSGTRPSSPVEGMQVFETDTDRLLSYDGTNWTLPDNVAGGTLGYAQVTASQTGITSITDLTGLSVTVTVSAGRRIRIEAMAKVSNDTLGGRTAGQIREGGTTLTDFVDFYAAATNASTIGHAPVVLTPSAGSHTYKLSLQGITGTAAMSAGASNPAFILVTDIGV